jgi:hypothetical protein
MDNEKDKDSDKGGSDSCSLVSARIWWYDMIIIVRILFFYLKTKYSTCYVPVQSGA